jgi:uncharacterized protein YbbC (DUF1343 family)
MRGAVWQPAASHIARRGRRRAVDTGLDVLRAARFAPLRGMRVALLTNHTGRAADGASAIELLFGAEGIRLVSLFSPEHGIRGNLDENVPFAIDQSTRLPIHSLYGERRRPAAAVLSNLDAVVVDLQDIGARFYTYITTMAYVMEEAAACGLRVFVLDRPNPIGGVEVEGPALDDEARSFVGYFPPMPVRHGLTIGELARLFNREGGTGADLTVIPMRHWHRSQWFDETGISWVGPSPNLPTLAAVTLYPGVATIEYCHVSVGRGTVLPFQQIGAPWIDGPALAATLTARRIEGVRFEPVRFTPALARYSGRECRGVSVAVLDRNILRPIRVGVEIAAAIWQLHSDKLNVDASAPLLGSRRSIARIKRGDDPVEIVAAWTADESRFRTMRASYLIY